MCLDTLKHFKPVRYGYQVVVKNNASYLPLFCGQAKNRPFFSGRWYWCGVREKHWPGYVPGFHVWHTLDSARRFCHKRSSNVVIVKVEVSYVLAVGLQYGRRVTVARRRKILQEVAR